MPVSYLYNLLVFIACMFSLFGCYPNSSVGLYAYSSSGTVSGVSGGSMSNFLVYLMPFLVCTMWPLMFLSTEGHYLAVLFYVRPAQNKYLPASIGFSHVDLTGYPVASWKYLTKAAIEGRSYALYAPSMVCLALLRLWKSYSFSNKEMFHDLVPLLSLQHVMNSSHFLSKTGDIIFVNITLQSASQNSPIPSRLWWNPGITCPEVGGSFRTPIRLSFQESNEVCGCPDAVPIWISGADLSTCFLRASGAT